MTKIKEINFNDLKKAFLEYKEKVGGVKYVSCFGKTFLEKDSSEYKLSEKVAGLIIKNGFGVLHGGYSGVMEAVSNGANIEIEKDSTKSEYLNIGVPLHMIDSELERSAKINLPTAEDLSDRKQALVELCDICVVLPSGGFGTMVESLEIFHLNQLAEKFGGKITPIIFFGGNWKKIFDNLYEDLDMNKQGGGEKFAYFISSIEELEEILHKLKV